MKINGLAALRNHIQNYSKSKKWIENWISDARSSQWTTPHQIKQHYASCSFLPGNVVIFNVCGNDFRLETVVAYKNGLVFVRWIGTHADYTRRFKKQP